MTMLRPSRWLRSVFGGRTIPLLTVAVAAVGTGLLLPAAVASTPHTHARRPLPTPLRTAAISDTRPHPAGKHPKSAAKARPAASTPATTRGKKGSKGHRQQPEPAPLVPMFRARRGTAPLGPATDRVSRVTHHPVPHGATRNQPAPLVSATRHSLRHQGVSPVVRGYAPARPLLDSTLPAAPSVAASASADHYVPPPHQQATGNTHPEPKPATLVASRPEPFAEGASHPEDDERLPRDKAVLGEDAPETSPVPVARVSAAPLAAPAATLPQSPVVQGFGGEIAVPTSPAAQRPGGTRRRNHPSNWQPEALAAQPEPLEEREAITFAAVSPAVLPEIYDRNGRLLMPAPLKGSHDVLVHQNLMATNDGLDRIYDDADLERLRALHQLVTLPVSESLRVNEDLPLNRRVARPWTVMFAVDMAHAYFQHFRQPLQVNSAVRTVRYQARLQLVNGNAAAISGDAASPHLTGQALDFGKRGMSQAELAWMRGYLLPLMRAGSIDVEEEFQQACFHISVYRGYAASRHASREVAQVRATTAETLADPQASR